MRKFLCKVFKFLLDLVGQVVDLVANTLIKVATAAVEVLSEVAGAVGGAIANSPLVWAGVGILAIFLLPKLLPANGEEKEQKSETRTVGAVL